MIVSAVRPSRLLTELNELTNRRADGRHTIEVLVSVVSVTVIVVLKHLPADSDSVITQTINHIVRLKNSTVVVADSHLPTITQDVFNHTVYRLTAMVYHALLIAISLYRNSLPLLATRNLNVFLMLSLSVGLECLCLFKNDKMW